ncbi:fungal-specific transcription factor domain-containing protein [Penicillium verhagenii]|nr:fungal-specific transcription factor domain-containing protein [Penicillium verhagenii]
MAPTNQTPRTRRPRSTVACEACRQRKVRCSLTVTGVPCAGCTQDGVGCIVNARERKGTKQIGHSTPRRPGHSGPNVSTFTVGTAPVTTTPCPSNEPSTTHPGFPRVDTNVETSTRVGTPSDFDMNNMADEEHNGLEIASAALGQPASVGEVPFYTGKSACDAMIEAYLVHVHPILPVIEADVLVDHHQAGHLQDYNILLLWSLFFVAVNSSLLMGFWHSDMDEHAQPWYWTGIAINLGQILGLHRDPDVSYNNPSITDRQRCVWRRLWWSCLFRDRWLCLTLGRPLRINLDDCDVRIPLAADLLCDTLKSDGSTVAPYLPCDMNRLAEYWVMLIELSCLLGNVLVMYRRPAVLRASLAEVEGLEGRLLRSKLPDQYEVGLTRIAKFYAHHVHLHYQSVLVPFHISSANMCHRAMLVTLYRRWETEAPDGLTSALVESWQHRMRLKSDAAASKTNDILDALIQEELLGFAGPMT